MCTKVEIAMEEQAMEAYQNELLTIDRDNENASHNALCNAWANACVYEPNYTPQLKIAIEYLAQSMGFSGLKPTTNKICNCRHNADGLRLCNTCLGVQKAGK